MIVAMLVVVIGVLPKALEEPGLLGMPRVTPEPVGRLFPAWAALEGWSLTDYSYL
jgi:hypothetical protein